MQLVLNNYFCSLLCYRIFVNLGLFFCSHLMVYGCKQAHIIVKKKFDKLDMVFFVTFDGL